MKNIIIFRIDYKYLLIIEENIFARLVVKIYMSYIYQDLFYFSFIYDIHKISTK